MASKKQTSYTPAYRGDAAGLPRHYLG